MANLSDVGRAIAAPPSQAVGLLAGLVTVVAWGSAFVGIRAAGASLSPGSIALGRLLVSAAILVPIALTRREPLPARRDLIHIAAYGVLWLAVYSTMLNSAERSVDAGTAAILINTGPILIAILAGAFLREGLPRGLFLGCAVAFIGASLIAFGGTTSRSGSVSGMVLCVIAAFAYAVAVVVQKPALSRVTSSQVTWLGVVFATIACLPFAPALFSEASRADASAIGWTIYLGAVPTALGFATWSFALKRASAGRTASLNYLIPVVAIALSWAILRETPPLLALVGGSLCVVGVYLARRRPGVQPAPKMSE